MKTAEEFLSDVILADDTEDAQIIALEAMKQYAKQVAEAVRQECMDGLEYEDANRIQQINLDQFIK